MSGIVGIVNLDGAPVDRDLLWHMTQSMAYRGPDSQDIWVDGSVGFGHAMLRTTWEAQTESQPLTLDGKIWLIADARIDGREELTAKLETKLGRKPLLRETKRFLNDAELILLAYEAWDEQLVDYLIGDFSFAIWDSRHRKLVCARDHFGVKPFYYAKSSHSLEIRERGSATTEKLRTGNFGDAILFQLHDNVEHRRTPVEGPQARTAFAGRFKSQPRYRNYFLASPDGDQS